MSDREAELRGLAADIRGHDAVADAFLAKSFTDLLVIVDVDGDGAVPDAVVDRLGAEEVYSAEEVYADEDRGLFSGEVAGATRHHFVDTLTRGAHQSYVVEES